MLEHGNPEARAFLPQLDHAQVTPVRCPCGCASIDLSINGFPEPSGGLHVLADFVFGTGDDLSGIFVLKEAAFSPVLKFMGWWATRRRCCHPTRSSHFESDTVAH